MSGLRIVHPTLRSCTLLVRHPGGGGRTPKDYYIRIDADGYTIVSETVWRHLQEAYAAGELHGFIVVNEVKDPPPLQIGLNGPVEQQRMYRQIREAIAEIAPGISRATITQEKSHG